MAYIKLQLSADRNRKNAALEKLSNREKLKKEEAELIRMAAKREKDVRRRHRKEERLQQEQVLEEESCDLTRLEPPDPGKATLCWHSAIIALSCAACGRARIIEKRLNWNVMSVCSTVLIVSVFVMLLMVASILLCSNFLEPSHCQSIRLNFIKTMASILEVLGAKVE